MAAEKITPEQQEQSKATQSGDKAAIAQKATQLAEQGLAKADAAAADAQAALAKANQALADIPGQIEDKIKEFKDTIDSFMNAKLPKVMQPEDPDFDVDAVFGKLKAAVNPVIGAISPIESVVGKVPVLGDLIGSMTSVTSQSAPTTLSKEDIKKLVPNKPQVPPGLMDKIEGALQSLMTFLQTLPMILIDVIFQMLGAIYDMFDQIVSVVGVPPPVFPFSTVKSCVSLMPKIKTMVMQLPQEVKAILMGVVQDKMAEAQALAIPAAPSLEAVKGMVADQAKVMAGEAAGSAKAAAGISNSAPPAESAPAEPPAPAIPAPAESAVKDVPKAEPIPPKAPEQPTIPEVKEQFKPVIEGFSPVILGAPGEFGLMDKASGDAYDYIFTDATIKTGYNPESTKRVGLNHAERLQKVVNSFKMQTADRTQTAGDKIYDTQPAWNLVMLADKTKYEIKQVEDGSDYVEAIDQEKDGFFSDGHVTKWAFAMTGGGTYGMTMPSFEHKLYAVPAGYVEKYRVTESSPAYQKWKAGVDKEIARWEKKNPDTAKAMKSGFEKFSKLFSEKYVFDTMSFPPAYNLIAYGKED